MTSLQLAAYAWWAALGLVLAFVDLAVQRLPARLSYATVTGFLVLLAVDAYFQHSWTAWLRAVLGAVIAAGVLAVCALAMPGLVHWGDVRFALAVGASSTFGGWLGLYAAVFLSTLLALFVAAILTLTRRANPVDHLPMGPFLYSGTVATVVLLAA